MDTVPHDGQILKLTDVIRQTSFEIHRYLRSGFTEKIYENALSHRLRKQRIRIEQQECIRVFDEDGYAAWPVQNRYLDRANPDLRNKELQHLG